MQVEQHIIGYFIEEAKEHLDTIEQGLLNLQGVIEDPEMLNEVFRAAHSVKGGAAMLGLDSIQQIAHWLEDCFKVLKEHPINVDQTLKSLLVQGFDTLRALLEQLQEPDGLSHDISGNAVREVEPIFAELKTHLAVLTSQTGEVVPQKPESLQSEAVISLPQEERTLFLFQKHVPARLRDMLQLFKQADQPANRQQLQILCESLAQMGEQFELTAWGELIEMARLAIANPQNSYSSLAPILVKEIKQARDQVLAGHPAEIFPSQKLKALVTTEPIVTEDELAPALSASEDESQVLHSVASTNDLDDIAAIVSDNLDVEVPSDNWAELLFEATNLPEAALPRSSTEIDLVGLFEDKLAHELPEEEVPGFKLDSDLNQLSQSPSKLGLEDLDDLEALLEEAALQAETLSTVPTPMIESGREVADADEVAESDLLLDDFSALETLSEETVPEAAQPSASLSAATKPMDLQGQPRINRQSDRGFGEQTMRVPVKHLDSFSNWVGELVVNRNSLEQNQERLRQSLDNLLYQVQQLSNMGQQMQDLYEQSLLETSLSTPNRHQLPLYPNVLESCGALLEEARHSTGAEFDALERDRFTGFHTLSQEIIERVVRLREAASDIEFMVDGTDQVSRMFRQATTQLQEGLNRSRMVPFADIAERLPRAVHDISLKYGKQANLAIEGKDTLIDKGILEQLYNPMTHLVSNALIHGIESAEIRQAAGKTPVGHIKIQAFYQGNQTVILVSDDGAGIDPVQIKAKALKKGLLTPMEAQAMSRSDVYDLLFSCGFSTKEQVDELAGRGVGMDIVRTYLHQIRGTINIDSTLGQGTTFIIRLPLTLSITKALCCIDNHYRIAFPIDGVEDILDISREQIQINSESQSMIFWNDSLIPFRPLAELLTYNYYLGQDNIYSSSRDDNAMSVVVLRSAGHFVALQVDQVLGEQEIIVKQLGRPVPKPIGVAGVTLLGDGRIMSIADVLELTDLAMGRLRPEVGSTRWSDRVVPKAALKTEAMVLIVDDSITVRELLSTTFRKAGYRVEQARDGQEAWGKLQSGLLCDLVFCDIEMPRMDGLELLSHIHKDPSLQHLPVSMLTSRGAERHRQMAIQLGAKGYFTKPYLEEALLNGAQRMLNGERLVAQGANSSFSKTQ